MLVYIIMSHINHNTPYEPQQIFLNSQYATTYINGSKKSNLEFVMEHNIVIPSNIDCFIQINAFKFVNAFYNITDTNNVFYWDEYSIVVPTGKSAILSILAVKSTSVLQSK